MNTTVEVKVIRKDRFGFQDTTGKWWNNKFQEVPAEITTGAVVEVYSKKDPFWHSLTLTTKGVDVLTVAPVPPTVDTSIETLSRPVLNKERTIIRQNALGNAVRFYDMNGKEATMAEVISVAREFEAYTAGDNDRESFKEAAMELSE